MLNLRGQGSRFALMVAALLALTIGLTTLLVLNSQHQLHRNHLTQQGDLLGRFVAEISPSMLRSYDISSLNKLMSEMNQHPLIVYAVITSTIG